MRSVKLSKLLWMVLVVPMAGLAAFAAILTLEAVHSLRAINRAAVLGHLATAAAHLDAFGSPGEGRATYPFLAQPTPDNRTAMEAQRRLTDANFDALAVAATAAAPLPAKVVDLLQRLEDSRATLSKVRNLVDVRQITRNEMGLALQRISNTSAELVGRIGGLIDDIHIARLVLALQGALETSTGGLQEGGRGEYAFQTGNLSPELHRNLLAGVELQRQYGRQLDTYGPRSVIAALDAFMNGPHGKLIQRIRPFMLDGAFDKLDHADAPAWTEADRARRAFWLEQLGGMENLLVSETERLRAGVVQHAYAYVGTSLVVVLLTALLGSWTVKLIRSHFAGLSATMNRLVEGDSDVGIAGQDRTDEIGALARGLHAFRDNLLRMGALEGEAARSREVLEARRRATMREMAEAFEQAIEGIVETVTASAIDLEGTASAMAGTAGATASITTTVSSAATEAASNVNRVAVAAEQLRMSVSEIGEQANASSLLAQSAVEGAADTAASIGELRDSASRAGAVVTMISSIAAQTNLLALNATIEAARAGETGRGFAVVAAEVKELSNQTARATSEASHLIARIQDATAKSVAVIELIAARVREISGATRMIAHAVDEQGAATQDIARNVSEAAAATRRVTSNIADAADAARSTGDAAGQVLASSAELTRQSEHLSREMRRFLGSLDAA